MDNQDHFSFVIREFKFEVQQVAGRNNGSKIFSNWLYILSPSLGRGKEGKGFTTSSPLPDPLPTGEGDKSLISVYDHCRPNTGCSWNLNPPFFIETITLFLKPRAFELNRLVSCNGE
jgi:hypothetical protein